MPGEVPTVIDSDVIVSPASSRAARSKQRAFLRRVEKFVDGLTELNEAERFAWIAWLADRFCGPRVAEAMRRYRI